MRNLINTIKYKFQYIECPVCLGEGRLVKTSLFGESIFKPCTECNGTKNITRGFDNYQKQRMIINSCDGGFKAINGEYAFHNDMWSTLYVKKKC